MPSEAIIASLDQLRESYGQRQRAANNLTAALKGAIGALAKTSRSLREYADQNPHATSGALVQSQEAFGALRLHELKQLAGITVALKGAH